MSEDKDAEIARLESEVASLRKERDEARLRRCLGCEGVSMVLSRAGDNKCDAPMGGVSRLLRRAESAESRLSALAAAAREYRAAEESRYSALEELEDRQNLEAIDYRPEHWPETEAYRTSVRVLSEKRRALDALLSGEEGR